jgi:UDP-glucose 4-epimerase
MNILVTGGTGFVGSHLVSYLREKGSNPVVFDLKQNPKQDVTNYDAVYAALKQLEPSYIYHVAGQSFMSPGEQNPWDDLRINGLGMVNILQAIANLNLDAVLVYTSTGAVYGLSELPHREDLVCKPMSNYGISKLAAEKYLQKWVATQGINAKIVRFSSVYGHHRKAGPVNIFCQQALKGGPLTVYGTGSQTRDPIHIEDVTRGLEVVAERGRRGEIYNIGCGEEHSVIEIARLVKRKRPHVQVKHVNHPENPFDLPRSWFDVSRMVNLGWEPRINLDMGVELTLYDLERKEEN